MRRRFATAASVSLAMIVAATAAHADKWIAATVSETFSANREWFVRITPGKSLGDTFGFDGSPTGPFAGAEWFRRDAEGGYRVVARATLANPVAPVDTLVTDHGYLVTLDNWHNMGYGAVVAAYRQDGSQVIALRLADLYARREIEAFETSMSSIWWRSDTVYTRDDQKSVYVAGKVRGHELILEPESGSWQICQPRGGRQQCRTTNEPRTWGSYREPADPDAYLVSDLQTLVRDGVRVAAVLGPQTSLHATAPQFVAATGLRDRRSRLTWMAARWAGVLTVADRAVARVVSPTATLCEASLAQTIDTAGIGGHAVQVMFGIAKAIDPSLAALGPPGLLHGGPVSPSSYKVERDAVQLAGGRMTVDAALDQFVTRLDGWGWWVEERCPPEGRCSCRVGMLTADSLLSPVYDISPPATRQPAR